MPSYFRNIKLHNNFNIEIMHLKEIKATDQLLYILPIHLTCEFSSIELLNKYLL